MKRDSYHFAFWLLTVVAAAEASSYLAEKPPYLTPCYEGPNFKSCYAKNFQVLLNDWKDGVPGLNNVGKMDPMFVKRVKIAQDGGRTLAVNADLRNLIITGISKGTVQEAQLNRKTMNMHAKIFLPILRFDCDLKAKGRVYSLNINGGGKSVLESTNVQMVLHAAMKLRDDNDLVFTEVEKIKLEIKEVGAFYIHIDNLFNGQKELEESTNQLFNENWREFFEILRPAIEQTMSAVLQDRLQKTFHYVPASYFVGDLPRASDFYG